MKRVLYFIRKKVGAALCVLLSALLVTGCLFAEGITVTASGEERSFDLGENAGSVTAVLGENGVLTISGSGAIQDFTADTAPFQDCQITSIKLGADLTAIGSYTFYNCKSLTGAIILPKGLLRIGNKAFSGDSAELAPRPEYVENPFTDAMVTRKKEPGVSSQSASSEAAADEKEPAASASSAEPAAESSPEPEELASSAIPEGQETVSSAPEPVESKPAKEPETASEEQKEPSQSTETENRYVIEHITQQEIGTEIFYPRTNGPAFVCSAENESFRAAMTAAGYQEAQAMLPVTLHYGKGSSEDGQGILKNIPAVDGRLTLPGVPPEFSAPKGDGLYHYVFSGWTETQDAPDTVRPAGSAFSAGERAELYLIANWNREPAGKIQVAQDGTAWVFTAPEPEGYEVLSYRWQTCVLEAGQKLPADQEQLSWKDISGETGKTYRHKSEPGNSGRWFRCIETVQKKQNLLQALFSADSGEEVAFSAVQGVSPAADDGTEGESAGIMPGKNYSGSISGSSAIITSSGAVTAGFSRTYTPSEKTENSLWLCVKREGDAISRIAFPAGTRLILGDMSSAESNRYYGFLASGGEARLPLSYFAALDGGAGYAPPAAGSEPVFEKLIVVVDFSGAGEGSLPQGEYFLAMAHESTQQPETAVKVPFTVAAAESCGLDLTREDGEAGIWKLTVSPWVSGTEIRYANGACIHLVVTTPDGQKTAGFPAGTVISGEGKNYVLERDGSLTFTMAANSSATVELDLSSTQEGELASGEYRIKAFLSPRAGLQMSGNQGTTDAEAEVGVSLSRKEASGEKRSVNVELGGDGQRLLDVSEQEADLAFHLSYRGIQPGDTLLAEVLCKTGEGPDSGSYSPAPGDWSISPASGSTPTGQGETLHLIVPKEQERGTYRLMIRIADSSGAIVAEQPYNFIVK